MDINIAKQEKMIAKVEKITKITRVIKTKQEEQKLLGKKIIELAQLCGRIEKHYKFPCDIEWAMIKNKFYITQSRPITTL